MQVRWQVEIDPYCLRVLEKHWPEVKRYGDIREIKWSEVEPVDLICGGFPCQPVSCAGKRQGDKDERWLWSEFYRAVCEVRPRWVLVENVPGLLSATNGRLFGGILGDLARCGYDAEWDLLPAAAFGAPHLRFRLFLVAHARSGAGLGRPLEPGREAERGTVVRGHGEIVAHSELRRRNTGSQSAGWQEGIETDRLCRRGRIEDVADAESGRTLPTEQPEQWNGIEQVGKDVSNPASPGQYLPGSIFAGNEEGSGPCGGPSRSDWWLLEPDVGRVAHGVPARVDRLKCLGNAVVPQMAEWIGKRIMETINDRP